MQTERTYNSIIKQRHFVNAVDALVRQKVFLHTPLKIVCAQAALLPAPRFYITPKQALEQYRYYKKYGNLSSLNNLTRQMYLEIFDRFDNICKNKKDFLYQCMQEVLNQQAPQFYINPDSAIAYYYRAINNQRKTINK